MDKSRRNRIAIISIMTYYARQIFDETKLYEFRKSAIEEMNYLTKKFTYILPKKIKQLLDILK